MEIPGAGVLRESPKPARNILWELKTF